MINFVFHRASRTERLTSLNMEIAEKQAKEKSKVATTTLTVLTKKKISDLARVSMRYIMRLQGKDYVKDFKSLSLSCFTLSSS
jgi:hypothetical protein